MSQAAATARVLRSALLSEHGVPHCFSTRIGGVSKGIFESLNLGNPSELPRERRDPPANIRVNFERILAAMGCPGRTLTEVHQVHGGDVHVVPGGPQEPGPDPKADAVICDDPRRVLAVRVADCVPILLATPDGRRVGAVHAGWRGVIAGVLPRAVAALRERGATDLLASIGPCIGQDHFEVGPEVAAEFDRLFGRPGIVHPGAPGKSHVDLKGALRIQLESCGIRRYDISDHCTHRDAGLFFSHRREHGLTGRTAGLIGARA